MSKKESFSLEYDFHASRQMLFQYLSTPSGLGEWFADNVNSRGEYFNFIWEDAEEKYVSECSNVCKSLYNSTLNCRSSGIFSPNQ